MEKFDIEKFNIEIDYCLTCNQPVPVGQGYCYQCEQRELMYFDIAGVNKKFRLSIDSEQFKYSTVLN